MDQKPLRYYKFMVDEKPYCLWDWDLKDRSISFLDGIDPEYFTYLAQVHEDSLDNEQKQHAALAIRMAHAQALETLFAFLGASLQAPYCVPAWLVKYSNSDLTSLVDKIRHFRPIYSSFGYEVISWEQISLEIHKHFALEDKEKEQLIKREFGLLWARFAGDFTDSNASREYNSIKHGFRARPGGFSFALGVEEQPGVPAPAEKMHVLGKSDFGSSFLIPENISEKKDAKHHFRLSRHSLNWSPEDMLYRLHSINVSINNIISYLKIQNGVDPEQVQFHWWKDTELYQEPWKRSRTIGINSVRWSEYQINEDQIENYSKEDIISAYRNENSKDNT